MGEKQPDININDNFGICPMVAPKGEIFKMRMKYFNGKEGIDDDNAQ